MLEGLASYLGGRTVLQLARDTLDVLLVYYIVYRALLVIRGTRAVQVGFGLGALFVLYIIAQLLQLVTLLNIMGAVVSSILLIIVVVFQNDIRRGLQRVGSQTWLSGVSHAQETRVIDEVVDAATELARHRTGAIITFEQDANLDEFVGVHKGHLVDAAVTRELLVSLFIPEAMNKLHDGAVIIRSLRIAKAGVFFPMPEGRVVDESFGSRHRAALGITEETDAVVVVVSEERGTISFCFNGNIASNLDGPKLRTMLEAIFSPRKRKPRAEPKSQSKAKAKAPRSARATPDADADPTTPEASTRSSSPPATPRSPGGETKRAAKPSGSEPPPPLRPRPAAEAGESIHNTGSHTRLSQAATPLSTRVPDSRRLTGSATRTPVAGEAAPPASEREGSKP